MKKTMVAIASLTLLAAVLSAYETDTSATEAKYYDNAKVIRIKNVEGEGFVQRSYEEGYEEATPNLPIFEKDVAGTTAGRLGIYLGRLNYLRLDSDTLVEMQGVPQLRQTDLVARLERGAIYLDIENLDKEKSIEIQTPDCGIFLLDRGLYRINVDENALTEVYVFEGIAEVAGQETSRNVRENQKIVMSRGKLVERPFYFYASEKDDFDHWNEKQNREQGYARYGTSRYLQSGYEDYEYEMSRSGRWSYMSEFNSYVWTPYYSNADWMPYANGRWVYHPFYGYVWTSYDSCGWFTHHYGRWHWSYTGGWYWIPAYRWSPAWVSWFWDSNYYGWCPLSWWNRPVIVINNRWDRNYNHRHGIPHHARSTIIIRKNQLTAVNAMRVALSKNDLEQTGQKLITYRGAGPTERQMTGKVNVVNARGNTVAYKQNAIVSSEKYKISDDAGQSRATKTTTYKYEQPQDAARKYSPRSFGSKDAESKTERGSEKYFRSKTSSASSSDRRARSSESGSAKSSAQPKDSARSNPTNSSSTSSDSSREAKKKKDEAAYMALLRSENSAGYKSHAAASAVKSSTFAAVDSDSARGAYRATRSQAGTEPRSAATRFASSGSATPAASDLNANRYTSRSYSNSSSRYTFRKNTADQSDLNQGLQSSGSSGTFSSRKTSNGDSNRSYGQTTRGSQTTVRSSRTSRAAASTATRSSGYSRSSGSSSRSSDSTRSAKKKN